MTIPPQLEELDKAMQARKITRQRLSDVLRVEPNTARRWFLRSHNRRNPSLHMLAKMTEFIYSIPAPK